MPTADEDNFDIDIYGDGEGDGDVGNDGNMDYKQDDDELEFQVDVEEDIPRPDEAIVKPEPEKEQTSAPAATEPEVQKEVDQSAKSSAVPSKPVPQQGVKRKETSDERPIDPGATTALMISELHWWTTEDDIRGWINEAGAEEELKELTFSEHKVNGKSKGQVYLEFSSPQAATVTKHKLDSLTGNQPSSRKHTVIYTSATQNPFKTLPKDAPTRARDERTVRGGSFSSAPRGDYSTTNQGYRGGRGGFNRGNYHSNNQYNRNFSGPMGGYSNTNHQNMGFQNNMGNNMGMGNNYGGFNNNRGGMMGGPMRGGMGGMRGGRGGMNNMMNMGGGMPMGNMGMNPMMAGMGMGGFQGNQFNPGMFNNQGGGPNFGGGDWHHGAKRQRQE